MLSLQIQHHSLDKFVFAEVEDTIPRALRNIHSKCERLSGDQHWMTHHVLPALVFIFKCLKEQHQTPSDVEVVEFCATMGQFQRYLRVAVSEKSVFSSPEAALWPSRTTSSTRSSTSYSTLCTCVCMTQFVSGGLEAMRSRLPRSSKDSQVSKPRPRSLRRS